MTGVLKAKVNGEWVPIGGGSSPLQQWNSAWGQLARGVISGGQISTTASGTDVGTPLVVQAVAGRRYTLRFQAFIYGDVVAGNYIQLGVKANGAYWGAAGSVGNTPGQGQSTQCETIFEATSSGTLTVQPYYGVYYGGGSVVMRPDVAACWYTVEDAGPIAGAVPVSNPTPTYGCGLIAPAGGPPTIEAMGAVVWGSSERVNGLTTNLTRITLPAQAGEGWYHLTCNIGFWPGVSWPSPVGTGVAQLRLKKLGADIIAEDTKHWGPDSHSTGVSASGIVPMLATDYIEAHCGVNPSSAGVYYQYGHMRMVRLGPF